MKDMTQPWYCITNTKLLVILGISVIWIFAGMLLYSFIGVSHGPEGGLDKIGEAIAYVFIWRLFIYGLPILVSGVSFCLWLYQNQRKAIIWLLLAIAVCIVLAVAYRIWGRKLVETPERTAARIDTFEKWEQKMRRYGFPEDRTGSDRICDYVKDTVSEAVSVCRSMYPDDDINMKTLYINAALEAHFRELPGVVGCEYIPDIRDIIPARPDGDDRFLLNNSELCLAAGHFQRTLKTDHYRDRYQFESDAIAEWYSWLPMTAIFYDDGTMDIVITP